MADAAEKIQVLVLAVDDNAIMLDSLATDLTEGGYDVLESRSADEAFKILEEKATVLAGLVTDVNLGRGQKTGWDIARRARQLNWTIPVVYVTGESAEDWAAQGVPHSVLIRKPYASAELVVALASLRKTD